MGGSVRASIDWLARQSSYIALLGLLCIAGFVLIDGVSRWLFAVTFPGLLDVIQVLVPVIVAACFPAGVMRGQHITIRFLGEGIGRRTAGFLDLLGAVLLLTCLLAIAQQLLLYAEETRKSSDVTWTIQLPLAPTWYAAALLFGFAAVAQLMVVAEAFRVLRTRSA
jgi:TRAP-type C4-dicarboxylate transport system permease small subunit